MIIEKFRTDYHFDNLLFDLMMAVFVAYHIFDNSAWGALNYWSYFQLFRFLKYGIAAVCVFLIVYNLIKKRYTRQALICYPVLLLVILASAWFSKNNIFVWYFLIFAAAYRQDARRVIFVTAAVTGFMLAFLVICSQTGLCIDYIFDETTRGRHGLGFGWTTFAPIIYLFFVLQYAFLRQERMRFYEYLILLGIAVYLYVMTDTNLTFFVTTAFLVFLFVEGFMKNRWKIWSRLKWFWIALPLLLFLLTFLIFMLYRWDDPFWIRINDFLHQRLLLGRYGIYRYGITAFGQPIEWHGYYITTPEVSDYNYIDCSYIQILLEFGVVFCLAAAAIYMNSMYCAVCSRNYYLVIVLAVVLLFSVLEPRLMNMTFNIFPLMAFLKLDPQPAISPEFC